MVNKILNSIFSDLIKNNVIVNAVKNATAENSEFVFSCVENFIQTKYLQTKKCTQKLMVHYGVQSAAGVSAGLLNDFFIYIVAFEI